MISFGLVIGESSAGVVNAKDYLWRLATKPHASQAGAYNEQRWRSTGAVSKWTPITGVASTSQAIVQKAL